MRNFTHKKKYLFYIKIIITSLILWVLAYNSQLKLELFYALFDNPISVCFSIGLCYLMVFLSSWRWYRLNSVQNIQLSYFRTIAPTYVGIAFNNVLPGSVGGDFVRLYYVVKKFPMQKSAAILSILVDRISGLMGILLIACAILPYYLDTFSHNNTVFFLLVTCVSLFVGGICFFLVVIFLLSEKLSLANWLKGYFSRSRWSKSIIPLLEAIHIYRNAKLILLESLIVSIMIQLLLLIVTVMINKMMGLPTLSLFDFMIALVIAQVANLLPLTPGGIGVGEVAFTNIIFLLNPGTTAAYATVFFALRLLSTIAYLPGVLFGIFGFNLLYQGRVIQSSGIES